MDRIAAIIVIINLTSKGITGTCVYPRDVYGTKYPWKIMSPDYSVDFRHSYRQVRFDNGTMVVYHVPSEGDTKAIVYRCEEGFNRERFMVSKHEQGRSIQYTCIQFIVRSPNVIQLKMAVPTRTRSPALCGAMYMKLIPAPLVYFHTYAGWVTERLEFNSYHACPLKGGFILREWSDERGQSAYEPDTLMPPIKLENECEKGEGLKFVCDKNRAKCPLPHTSLHRQNNFCLASWMDDDYTYMMLYNTEDARILPCLRYENKHGNKFTVYLFLDGVCDTGFPIRYSRHYRKLSLVRETESYCGDRTRMCAKIERSKCARGLADYCRFTCGVCVNPSAIWNSLRVNPEFRGTWVKDTLSMGYENIVFDHMHLNIPSLGKYRLYEKYWYNPEDEATFIQEDDPNSVHVHHMMRKEYLMIASYNNGCSPRVSLLNIAKRSDAVISLRISQPAVIEHFSQTQRALEYMDKLLDFKDKPRANVYESYRTMPGNWFNVVRFGEEMPTVACDFGFTHFRVKIDDGRYCEGAFEKVDAHNFEMIFKACNSTNIPDITTDPPHPVHFQCLATFSGDYGNMFVLTGILGGMHHVIRHSYMCWAFSRRDLGTVYWMRVSECDVSTEDYIDRGLRTPIARLSVADMSDMTPPSEYMRWIICFMIFFMWLFGI